MSNISDKALIKVSWAIEDFTWAFKRPFLNLALH